MFSLDIQRLDGKYFICKLTKTKDKRYSIKLIIITYQNYGWFQTKSSFFWINWKSFKSNFACKNELVNRETKSLTIDSKACRQALFLR